MDEILKEMPVIYCYNCGARLGRLDDDSRGGFLCTRCRNEFEVIRHENTVTQRMIRSKNEKAVV